MIIRGEKVFLRPIRPSDFPNSPPGAATGKSPATSGANTPHAWKSTRSGTAGCISDRHSQHWRFPPTTTSSSVTSNWTTSPGAAATRSCASGSARRAYWDQGFGTDAVRTLVEYAFRSMRLSRVYLRVFTSNVRAIRCYEKVGFRKEGRL